MTLVRGNIGMNTREGRSERERVGGGRRNEIMNRY